MTPEPGVWTIVTHPTSPRRYVLWLDDVMVGSVEAPPSAVVGGWGYAHRVCGGGVAATLPHALAALHDRELDCLARAARHERLAQARSRKAEPTDGGSDERE